MTSRWIPIGYAIVAALAALLSGQPTFGAPAITPAPGGEALYAAHCASCHGPRLEGGAGPRLIGPRVQGLSAEDVTALIKATMPADAPGSLPDDVYAAIGRYLVEQNARSGAKPSP